MLLAESAQVEVRNYVNSSDNQSYSVTTTTVNGVTTTDTKTYAPGEPVILSASASARGEVLAITPVPTPAPPTAVRSTPATLFSFLKSLFSNLYHFFRR